ncbi:hypothetical protein D3C87_2037900 [compost metagenome]
MRAPVVATDLGQGMIETDTGAFAGTGNLAAPLSSGELWPLAWVGLVVSVTMVPSANTT